MKVPSSRHASHPAAAPGAEEPVSGRRSSSAGQPMARPCGGSRSRRTERGTWRNPGPSTAPAGGAASTTSPPKRRTSRALNARDRSTGPGSPLRTIGGASGSPFRPTVSSVCDIPDPAKVHVKGLVGRLMRVGQARTRAGPGARTRRVRTTRRRRLAGRPPGLDTMGVHTKCNTIVVCCIGCRPNRSRSGFPRSS
jgi:hypothetical protein